MRFVLLRTRGGKGMHCGGHGVASVHALPTVVALQTGRALPSRFAL